MSLPESEEILSAIKQLQEKMKTEQGIFEEADKDLKGLQKDIQDKQKALDTLKDNLQQEDNDALELLGKLWKQQEKIKGHLAAQSADAIIQAVQEQNEFIDLELELIKQQYENIALNLKICREFEQFLREDGQNTSHRSIEHKEAFAKFLEGSELLKEDDKKELLEKNSQLMTELNASMQNLEKRDGNLIEQKKKLEKKDLANNLAVDVQPILQKLFKEQQAEIEKEIEVILAENSTIVEQYKNVKLREEEIKKIQGQIEQKTQIIEQSKQKEEQLFEELKQLEQKSYPPLSSAKQQQEGSVSHYPILQERANDAEASLKRQIEINKLNEQLKIAQEEAADQTYQLEQLKLSTDKERLSANMQIKENLAVISELQERIRELQREKEGQQIGQQPFITPNDLSLFDELGKALKTDRVAELTAEINELTQENNSLKTQLEEIENEKKQLVELSGEKELEYNKAKEDYAAELQEINKEVSKLKSEQQEKQVELDRTKEELTGTSKKLFEAEELYGQESKQAKELQEQVEELSKTQHQLTTELEKTKEEKENQIKALTEAKKAANLDLQVAEEKYAGMLKGQSELAAAELRTINEELLKLKSEQQEKQAELDRTKEELTGTSKKLFEAEELYGQESKQAKELQEQVEELSKTQHQLTTELEKTKEEKENQIKALTEAKKAANLDLQVAEEKYAGMLKGQSELAAAELRTINEELLKLKSEQQEKQAELDRTKEELTGTSKKLFEAEELYGQESKQAKELQEQVEELSKTQHQLTTELEKTKEEKENQIKALTEAKKAANLDLQVAEEKYAGMLKGQSELAAAELRTINEELSKLKLEQQEKQTELDRTKEELTGTSKKLFEAEELYGQESKQAKELQEQVEELSKTQHQLTTELEKTKEEKESQIKALTEAKKAANSELQVAKENYAAMLKEQSDAAVAKLQTINEELSQLKSEQREKQAELQRAKEELTNTHEELVKAERLHGQESEQAKELQEQVEELSKTQHQLTTELEKTKEEKENQIKALTEGKEAANSELQVAKENYAAMLKEQSEAAAVELQTINEELSKLKSEQQEKQTELQRAKEELTNTHEELVKAERLHGQESEQAKELQDQLGGLTNENNSLKSQLEKIENARKQLETLSGKKDLEYNYLEAEYEKQQAELKKIQEDLTLEKLISAEQYEQNKNFKTQLNKVNNENEGLKSQLEKIKKDTKNQPETLSAAEKLKYNALVTKQKGDIDELWRRLEVAKEHAQRIQEDEQARVTELRDKDIRIAALARQNAALLSQLEKLQIKPEAYEVEIQTDNIAGKSIGTETETITKEFRAVDSQTDNRQKLYQSVGTEYRPVMDSGVSVDKVLVQDKTKGNVYDDDKILQAFKELSREQVQPIVNKCSLQSTSSFAQFAQENVGKLSEAFRDSNVLREIENIEQRGYTDIHKKFAAEYKDIAWQENIISPESGKSFNLKQNGKDVVTINETTLSYDVSHDDKNAKYKTREGEEIKNARMVNIPLSIDMQGACHMSFAVQDTNGRNIGKEDAVYLTAHYKNGKLVHLTKPTEIFSCSDDNKSPLYLKRKGKTYTLPVDKSTLEQLEQEVLKNKGEYVGIVRNVQGNIKVNSAAVHGLQPDRVTADPLFKDASQLLHDANATPALDGSLDMKGLAHKKPNRNVGSGRNP
ncbi:hypothetical protein [Candidatus Tisiphia endosymbiont of Piscicola geometra]|uniref:hypothetical protein n=1 Tax=Candidatus Tisiphia endosymbiont of Piscicola geometra TaxID=3066273 RepID=UPI00312C7B74